MKLYLLRHGETVENNMHILQGQTHGTLSEKGRAQVAGLRESINPDMFDIIISSDLHRVTNTVEIWLDGRQPKEWLRMPLFRERDWGSLTGRKTSDIDISQLPDDVETKQQLYDRAGKALDYLMANYRDKTVLVASHGLFLQFLMARIANVPIENTREVEHMRNCETRCFDI